MSDLPPPPPPPGGGYPPAGPAGAAGLPAPLAEFGPRVIARLVDIGIQIGGFIALIILSGIFGAMSDALGALVYFVGLLALAAFGFYQIYMEGTTGQTIGKKMQKVKVVGLENGGQPIGFAMAFVRYFINQLICGLGWLLLFFDAQRQTVGDKVSKSVVVAA